MSTNINLISKRPTDSSNNTRTTKIRNFSFILLFFVALSSLVLFLVNLRFSVNYVKKQQNDLIKQISTYDETTSKIILLNSRIDDINSLLGKRKKYNETTSKIFENSDSIKVEAYTIDDTGISIEISSNSLLLLNDFLNHTLKLSKSKVVQNVSLESLASQSSGYLMKIKAN